MEYKTPDFTKEMIRTHKILIPNMAVTQFKILAAALEREGYSVELLDNCGSQVAQLGLKYVHNDTCYPALLVIGQFLDALNSGKYDLDHTALLITQTGGGCRASNYIKLLKKALVKAGYGNIPVVSFNFSGLEQGSSLQLNVRLVRKLIACLFYGDLISSLRSQVRPYENNPGEADAMSEKWIDTVCSWMKTDRNYSSSAQKHHFEEIIADFASISITRVPKVKVGVVGEIYVKYSPLGNNDLVRFLESQNCEVNLPGITGFVEYCIINYGITVDLYGGPKIVSAGANGILDYFEGIGKVMNDTLREYGFYAPGPFRELMKKPDGIISLGAKMGEGWLLTAEMVELVEDGYDNIVCAQPFGCLPNHIAGKGMINTIHSLYPEANITPVDYDPSAALVNQQNRIKLMLAVGEERLHYGSSRQEPRKTPAENQFGLPITGRKVPLTPQEAGI
ncbi:MAG: 2-hydroxyglutaryl-CoA dehydratase [Eubacteriaceae bacterium]|jgi:predicted nucleotide-binding protein (sugar kinase/HSP70/actin superfamily)